MSHEEAITNQVAASYLLGDLSAAERDAFEEHYFDCRVCAEDVRAGAAMFATGREVAANAEEVRRFRPLKWAASGAAAAALTMVVGYQSVIIPRVQSLAAPPVMEVMRPTPLVPGATRGEQNEEQVIRFTGDEPVALYREIPPESPFPRYQFQLRTAAGKVLVTSDVPPELAAGADPIPLKVHRLPAGRYVLAILGVRKEGNRTEIDRWRVVVQ
jgi:hypothetical protein